MKLSRRYIAPPVLVGITLGTAWMLPGQTPSKNNSNNTTSDARPRATPNPRAEAMVLLAENSAPEVGADVLLTISSSSFITDKQRKIAIINDAFRLAGQAREPVKRKSWSRVVDTRAGFKQMAFDLGLDKLSMQSRAVVLMLPLDPFRARVMFNDITLPPLTPLSCEDSLVYDVDSYYQTMFQVAETGFTADEKTAGAHIQFVFERLENIRSIAQVSAAAKVLGSAKLSPEEFAMLSRAFAKALDRVSTDPRSFAYAMERGPPFVSTLHRLILKAKNDELPVKDLTSAIRSFLTRNMAGEVCADVDWIKTPPKVPVTLESINEELAAPITTDDLRPASLGAKASDASYWTTSKARALLMQAKSLRFGGTTTELTPEERQTESWRQRLSDFLQLIEDWDAASELSADDYFQEKCNMYRVLVDLCPDDLQRDAVLRVYGNYLKDSNVTYKGKIEWILQVKEYLRALRSRSEKSRQAALDPWLSSSDSALRLYGELALTTKTVVTPSW